MAKSLNTEFLPEHTLCQQMNPAGDQQTSLRAKMSAFRDYESISNPIYDKVPISRIFKAFHSSQDKQLGLKVSRRLEQTAYKEGKQVHERCQHPCTWGRAVSTGGTTQPSDH